MPGVARPEERPTGELDPVAFLPDYLRPQETFAGRVQAFVEMARAGGAVKRCHIVRTHGSQTNAEHMFGVALLCVPLADFAPSAELLKAALFHDLSEQATGDIPAQVKWGNPAIKAGFDLLEAAFNREHGLETKLTEEERTILKWADSLELAFYTREQEQFGNQHVGAMIHNLTLRFKQLPFNRAGRVLAEYLDMI